MSRYNLRPYVSVYKDPGSVQINTLQRQKFQQAFNADDAIAGAVDQMKAADFEGDQALKMELEQNTRQSLQDRAARGDYETMMMDVSKSARTFQDQYSPIEQNYNKYQAYQQSLKEAYDKGPENGGINAYTYQRSLAKSRFGYNGLQKNEDGTVDDGSFFNGFNFVKDVDIQSRMSDLMKDFAVKEYGNEGKVISEDGNYYITNGIERKTVTPEQVATVFNNLIAQPDVAAAIQQKTDLTTFDITDETIRQQLSATLYGDEDPETENNGLIGLRDKAIQEGKDEDAAAYDARIKEITGLLNAAGVETEDEMIQKRKDFMRSSVLNEDIQRELGVSVTKFAFDNKYVKSAIEYTDKWGIDYKNFIDNYSPNSFKRTGVSEINNPGGNNQNDIQNYIRGNEQRIVADVTDFNTRFADALKGRQVTVDDILNGNFNEQEMALLKDILPTYQSRIKTVRNQIGLQNSLLERAYESSGYIESFDKNVIAGDFEGKTGREIIDAVKTLPGLENRTDQQIVEYIRTINDQRLLMTTPGVGGYEAQIKKGVPQAVEIKKVIDAINTLGNNAGLSVMNEMAKTADKIDDDINEYLKDNSKINIGDWTSNNVPMISDPKTQTEVTSEIKNFLTGSKKGGGAGKLLDKTFTIYYDGQKQGGAGTPTTFAADMSFDSDDLMVVDVSFDTTPYMGEPTLQLTVKGKKGGETVQETVIMPYSNIKNERLQQIYQTPGFRLQQELQQHRVVNAPSATIGAYKDGVLTSQFEFIFDKERGDMVRLSDGKIVPITDPRFISDVSESNNYEFRSIF